MSGKRWEFKLDSTNSSVVDPHLGYKCDDTPVSAQGVVKKPQLDKSMLDRKAWEAVLAPAQGVAMNLFMLWMMGSNPGIFGIMMLVYALSTALSLLQNVNNAFLPFTNQGVDCSLQKIAYCLICLGVLGYLAYLMSGMGLLPTQSGDWISIIKGVKIRERIL